MFSCQDEFENETQSPENSISKTATLATLLSRVSQNRTTFDNIIDGTSCFSIQLPVTITVDSDLIKIESESDYKIVKALIDESSSDDDDVQFSYPITLVYRNYKSVQVNNKDEFENILKNCTETDDFQEIDCININYPISINTYDKNNQIALTLTVKDNIELFNLLENMNDTDLLSVVYPLKITLADGEILSVNNNSDVLNLIESVIGICYPEDIIDNELSSEISKGTWFVSYFLDESEDETSNFKNYNFLFSSNGNVTATKYSTIINGTWNIYNEGANQILKINFDDSNLEEIDAKWVVINSSATIIKLVTYSDNGGEIHYLTFSKN